MMRVRGDIESVNLRTGEMKQRVTGEGENKLIPAARRPKRILWPQIGGKRVPPKPTLEDYDRW
jgi:hypothetical protein